MEKLPAALAVKENVPLVSCGASVKVDGSVPAPLPPPDSVMTNPPEGAGSLVAKVTVTVSPTVMVAVGAERVSAAGGFTVRTVLAVTVTGVSVSTAVNEKLAETAICPGFCALAIPLDETAATVELEEFQVATVVKSWAVPSVIMPVAVKGTDEPTYTSGVSGTMPRVTSSAAVIVTTV
jgi:hypothetical protein